jgi:hypothetical protein
MSEAKFALELDPLSFPLNFNLGAAFTSAGRYDQAVEQDLRTVELLPNHPISHLILAMACWFADRYEEPVFDELHDHPRFGNLYCRSNLPE